MKRLGGIFGSITFRLALAYTLIFGLSVVALFTFVFFSTTDFVVQQKEAAIEADVTGFQETFERSGVTGLIIAINRRANPGTNRDGVYLLVDSVGSTLAGNLQSWPRNAVADDIWVNFSIDGLRQADAEIADVRAKQYVIPGGQQNYMLLVGRDVRDARELRRRLVDSLNLGLAITLALGVVGGFVFSRTIMRRIEAITRTCRRIMSGDLSQRVVVSRQNDELGQLSLGINAMLDQIERLMNGMRQVSDNVAHDLRTPLTRLRSRLEGALRHTANPADRETIEGAIADADSLLATFAALLRIARAEAGSQRAFVDFDIHALIEEVVDLYSPLAEEKGLKFITQLQPGLSARGDPNLIAQALANLIDNAVKYTEQGSVAVALTTQDGRPALVVADTGPGVPEAFRGKVLERLFRLEQSRTSPGSGLGLSLVAAVAKSHGMELKLEDNLPGLRVTLQFPRQKGAASDSKAAEVKPAKPLTTNPRSGPPEPDSVTPAAAAAA
ncbi:MAG: HAMP domain-containing histidine kinase [Rhodospirillaceae bacterium]|nr:HAMP domain-containing histidine kinase [Rhodospirillaceae bacterium]